MSKMPEVRKLSTTTFPSTRYSTVVWWCRAAARVSQFRCDGEKNMARVEKRPAKAEPKPPETSKSAETIHSSSPDSFQFFYILHIARLVNETGNSSSSASFGYEISTGDETTRDETKRNEDSDPSRVFF